MSTELVKESSLNSEANVPAVNGNMHPLAQLVLQSGNVNTSELRELFELQKDWERNQAEKEFNHAMHECQKEMPSVAKDAQNTHTKSRYVRLETVQAKCRPIYSEHGFSLNYGEEDCPVGGFKRTVCDVRHVGGACHRYHLDLPIDGTGARGGNTSMNAVQGCISTTSYAQRRLLCMIFNITLADEDDDGNGPNIYVDEKELIEIHTSFDEMNPKNQKLCLDWLKSMGIETMDQVTKEVKPTLMKKMNQKIMEQAKG